MLVTKVFVYGTLKRGFDNHALLADSKFIGKAKTLHTYPMICKYPSFPYLIDAEGEGFCVEGEVFEVTEQTMLRLDELEGYPQHYVRREIEVALEDGVVVEATAYFLAEKIKKIKYEKYPFLRVFEVDGTYF